MILTLLLLTVLPSFYLTANPFLGNTEKEQPVVRPPSSGGFMVETQLKFREILADKLEGFEEGSNPALYFPLLGAAFLYGILHAAGPGHRKTVIFSLFLSRKTRWYEPLAASFVSAGVHGGTAVILILLFQLLFNSIRSADVQNISSWLEGISYSLLMLLALWFLFRRHSHRHDREIHGNIYGTLAASSFFPCPGVIMIMTFSAALGVLKTGILAVISLSAGMGATISLAAYLAYFGRESLFLLLKEKERFVERTTAILEKGSYLFLFIFSLWMAYPFFRTILLPD